MQILDLSIQRLVSVIKGQIPGGSTSENKRHGGAPQGYTTFKFERFSAVI